MIHVDKRNWSILSQCNQELQLRTCCQNWTCTVVEVHRIRTVLPDLPGPCAFVLDMVKYDMSVRTCRTRWGPMSARCKENRLLMWLSYVWHRGMLGCFAPSLLFREPFTPLLLGSVCTFCHSLCLECLLLVVSCCLLDEWRRHSPGRGCSPTPAIVAPGRSCPVAEHQSQSSLTPGD